MTSAPRRRRPRRHHLTVSFVVSFSTCLCGGLVRWSMAFDGRVAGEILRYRTDWAGD